MRRIKVLDSFRGIAALIVVFHHVFSRFNSSFGSKITNPFYPVMDFVSALNVAAVMFFFILSGFSIRLSLKNGMPITKTRLNDYLYRRFKRILPLYLIAIVLTVVCGIVIQQLHTADYSFKNLIGNMLFLQCSIAYKGNWFSPYGSNGPLWSLSFEMFYYLFFPCFIYVFVKVCKNINMGSRAYLISLVLSLLFSIVCIGINNHYFFPYIAFGTLFYIWYSGYFLAEAYLQEFILSLKPFLFFTIIAIFLKLLLLKIASSNIDKLFVGSVFALGFCCFYFMRQRFTAQFIRYFETPVNFLFYKAGKGSYALYLIHYPVLGVLTYFNANLAVVIGVMCFLVILSPYLEEYFVKKKFLILKRRYIL
jgi:peptidoglycan/LPS O-acetylase OafA/YrhL